MFIKLNEERSQKEKFINSITKENIIFEIFVSDTSAQNNHIERKKNILLTKEKTMRIYVDLSIYL